MTISTRPMQNRLEVVEGILKGLVSIASIVFVGVTGNDSTVSPDHGSH